MLFGGPGNDTAQMDFGDFFDGGFNIDGVDFFGTRGNDHIVVSRQVGPDGPQALIEMNNKLQVFNYLNGETINVFAGTGNDQVVMDASAGTHWIARFFGEQGNDHLFGGAMGDLLDGGPGNDFLDGGAGDNVLIGGGGHDVLRNGHPPVAATAIAGAAPALVGTSTSSVSASVGNVPVQLEDRSHRLELRRIDSYRASLTGFFQKPADKNTPHARAVLLEPNTLIDVPDDELLDALRL
jgi:Ca2+-binding RTX toxin-like protein